MNKNRQLLFSAVTSVFITTGAFAQEKSKTFKETFNVGDNTVLNINTSNTDIEFETWNKDQVEIVATIELDGASSEEAERYFEKGGIEIKGNSKEIEISTGRENHFLFNNSVSHWTDSNIDFDFNFEPLFEDLKFPELAELSELSELSELTELAVIPKMSVIPNLPPIPNIDFDYEAYQKDGEKYMKEWKKQFDKGFDEEFKKNFEEWGEEFKRLNEERNKSVKEMLEKREEERKIRRKELEKAKEARNLQREALRLHRDSLIKNRDLFFAKRDSLRGSYPNIFYLSKDGNSKRYKVKKTIKIKMPKSVKLKMNVRHGEVKLAETTKNMDASLQYVSLLASTIDGNATNIRVSYSPVQVQKWNYGQLKTDYSDRVNLKEVGELRLNSVSSNVVIDRLNKSVLLTNNLGAVQINSVSDNFTDIDVSLKNGEFNCRVPKTPVSFYLNGTKSRITYPAEWTMERTKNFDNVVCKGFQENSNSGKSIRVNSKYSEVSLQN
ncbi:hypothetical protein MTsPCn9_01300 [Croceitalea sp. MTPC9]|uniref:hypothetical protein n=1 Tax=unclassified Croceitalea TaxID=2632280 RepID=UPI002B3C0B21|nr:hypothetical protein MTsPCn6_07410 [Croceitalea sp. MTPC6]GMN15194.1 hypothetical protein MTsPCn9_01300 [Croceitalea sp. MTPC9]